MLQASSSFGQQLAGILAMAQNKPYTDFVSNLILGIFALLVIFGALIAIWISTRPQHFQALLTKVRSWSLVRFVEKIFTSSLQFLLDRFSMHGAYGISFTIALAIFCSGIWLFAELLENVVAQSEAVLLDQPLLVFIASHRQPALTSIMHFITLLGEPWFVIPLAVLAGVLFWYKTKSWQSLYILASAVTGAGIFDLLFKSLVARARPLPLLRVLDVPGYAFPSGHAALTVFYIMMGYLIARRVKAWQLKVVVWVAAILMAVLIGISRVYLGVHWPTDVIGGWALALVWASLVIGIASLVDRLAQEKQVAEKKVEQSLTQELFTVALPNLERSYDTGPAGLSSAQVAERVAHKQVNTFQSRTSRTVGQICSSHIFTRFNALLGTLVLITVMVGEYRDALFGIIIVLNTAIGIIQELRSKWTLDHLVLLTMTNIAAVRNGQVVLIPVDQIVVDDVLSLKLGNQIPVDGVVLSEQGLEIDESQLTGESEPVHKASGDKVYSGSFVVAGDGLIQAIKVGESAYANQLAKVAQKFSLVHSELRTGIDKILQVITWLLVFTVPLLFISQLTYGHGGWREAIIGAIAGVVGMVPEGLVLLTSVVMATAVVRLARKSALIQELAAVEILARVDVLCVDKTGTLTDGKMAFDSLIMAEESQSDFDLAAGSSVLRAFVQASANPNPSLAAIGVGCGEAKDLPWSVTSTVAFSSSRKWSALAFAEHGLWVLGAPEMVLLTDSISFPEAVQAKINQGKRVLVLASSQESLKNNAVNDEMVLPSMTPKLYVVLSEELRPNVMETLAYFKQQGITLKVISGDSAQTVAAVAKQVGIADQIESIDTTDLPTDVQSVAEIVENNTVFGRVTPSQKQLLIRGLQAKGHTVAMVGDGVNDVLALKSANFGVAMGAGSDATRAIAQLILLNNDFGVLPDVIAEGRRVISNMERTANLFITKTTYAFLLALAVQVARVPFPFLPRHLTIISFFTIGIPALLLSFAKSSARAKPGFVSRVLGFSVPMGALLAGLTLIAYALIRQYLPFDMAFARTGATITLVICGFSVLFLLEPKTNIWQRLMTLLLIVAFALVLMVPASQHFFALRTLSLAGWGIVGSLSLIGIILIRIFGKRMLKRA